MATTEQASKLQLGFQYWVTHSVSLPLLIFLMLWPANRFVWQVEYSFIATFSTAELLAMAALIILGVVADIEVYIITGSRVDIGRLIWIKNGSTVLAVCYILAYGLIRSRVVPLLGGETLGSEVRAQLMIFALTSLCCLFLALAISAWAKQTVERRLLDELANPS